MKKQTTMNGTLSALVLAMFGMANIADSQDSHTKDLAATWDPQTKETVDGEQVYSWNAGNFDNWVDADRNPGADPSGGQVGIIGTGPERAVLDGAASVDGDLHVGMERDRKSTVYRGAGELEITSNGDLKLSKNNQTFIGYNKAGRVNQNGGTVTLHFYAGGIKIGRGSQGIYNLNSGTLKALEDVYVGVSGDHNSQMNIRGGTFDATDHMSVFVGTDGTGTFSVKGSKPDSITMGKVGKSGDWIQGEGGTLKLGIDEDGITPIELRRHVTFKDGARLDVSFLEGAKRIGTWDVMTWEGELTNDRLHFADSVDTDTWNFSFVNTTGDGTSDTLRVSAMPDRSQRIASVKELTGEVPEKAVRSLVHILESERMKDRLKAVETLTEMGPEAASALSSSAAAPAVEVMLKHGTLPRKSIDALTAAGVAEEAVPDLVDMLEAKDNALRLRAVNALQMIGPDAAEAAKPLVQLLDDSDLRKQAADALTAFGSEALPVLGQFLENAAQGETSTKAQQEALEVLGNLDGPEKQIALVLVEVLHRTQEDAVRSAALKAINARGAEHLGILERDPEVIKVLSRLARPQEKRSIREPASVALSAMNMDLSRSSLGNLSTLENWSGLEKASGAGVDGGDVARLKVPGEATFRYVGEDSEQGADWTEWPVLALDVNLSDEETVAELNFSLLNPPKADFLRPRTVRLTGEGWHTVYVAVADFRLNDAVEPVTSLNKIRGLRIEASGAEHATGELLIANPRLQRGKKVALTAPVESKSAEPGKNITYEVSVANCSDTRQAVTLGLDREGGEVMVTTVEPDHVLLDPGEVRDVTVRARIPTAETPGVTGKLPEGARERWTLRAIPNGRSDLAEEVDLIHVVQMEPPYIVHSERDWNEIRKLIETEDWARQKADTRVKQARGWNPGAMVQSKQEFQHSVHQVRKAWNAAQAWQLTRDKEFAEKVADYFRMISDPGSEHYLDPFTCPVVRRGNVNTGKFYRPLARAYDAVRDADVFTAVDSTRIERLFRRCIGTARRADHTGNHPLSAATGGLYLALALQDWGLAEYFLEGPGGIYWQIRRYIMDDGSTAEVSTNYTLFSAGMLTKAGLALRKWGVDILNDKFPAIYHESVETSARPGESPGPWLAEEKRAGMFASVWGPHTRTYRSVRDLWDTAALQVNEDGKVPGLNDSHPEQDVTSAGDFDLAAYAYGNPDYTQYASGKRLLYPVDVSEGANNAEDELLPSYRLDNLGVAMLRPQGVESINKQYQAMLSYGSHGLHHGHWDRLNLAYLRRYGKLATYNCTGWFSYGNFMYQMYQQTSMAHSMVVVDGKNQYPAPSDRLLWHTGEIFQAVAVENESRWSNPRFRSDLASEEELKKGVMEYQGYKVEIPEDPPEPGHMTDFTEPIRSRRLLAATDEYVLVLDNIKGEKEHTFNSLYYFNGFSEFDDSADIEFVEEREQFDDSPLRAGQFITDCRIYKAKGPVRAHFEVPNGLHIDVYSVWPRQRGHIVGRSPKGGRIEGFYSAGRVEASEASFVTLIELQEDTANRQVQDVTAESPNLVRVKMTDGRLHTWRFSGLQVAKDQPEVEITMVEEGADGRVREESTKRSKENQTMKQLPEN